MRHGRLVAIVIPMVTLTLSRGCSAPPEDNGSLTNFDIPAQVSVAQGWLDLVDHLSEQPSSADDPGWEDVRTHSMEVQRAADDLMSEYERWKDNDAEMREAMLPHLAERYDHLVALTAQLQAMMAARTTVPADR